MEGTSSDDENDLFPSDEDGEHNVEHFMLCSGVHLACSPLLQSFADEEELCAVALTCHCSLDVVSLSGLSGSLSRELGLWHLATSFLTLQI